MPTQRQKRFFLKIFERIKLPDLYFFFFSFSSFVFFLSKKMTQKVLNFCILFIFYLSIFLCSCMDFSQILPAFIPEHLQNLRDDPFFIYFLDYLQLLLVQDPQKRNSFWCIFYSVHFSGVKIDVEARKNHRIFPRVFCFILE